MRIAAGKNAIRHRVERDTARLTGGGAARADSTTAPGASIEVCSLRLAGIAAFTRLGCLQLFRRLQQL